MITLHRPDTIAATCRSCQKSYDLLGNMSDVHEWMSGKYIQDAMPYLTPDERELLISGTCKKCFDKMFGKDPIGDADTEYVIEFEDDV